MAELQAELMQLLKGKVINIKHQTYFQVNLVQNFLRIAGGSEEPRGRDEHGHAAGGGHRGARLHRAAQGLPDQAGKHRDVRVRREGERVQR